MLLLLTNQQLSFIRIYNGEHNEINEKKTKEILNFSKNTYNLIII